MKVLKCHGNSVGVIFQTAQRFVRGKCISVW